MRATDICITFFLHLALALPEIYYSPMKLFLVNIYKPRLRYPKFSLATTFPKGVCWAGLGY